MSILRILLILILFTVQAISNENQIIRFINLDIIVKDSKIGKKISNENKKKREDLIKKNKSLESKLEKQKNDILSKKNILDKKEFEEKVIAHEKEVNEYRNKVNNDIKILNDKSLERVKKLKIEIDKILVEYAEKNKIDLIFNKDTLIVSNSDLDVTKEILMIIDDKIKKID